jgi:hypothetical protein
MKVLFAGIAKHCSNFPDVHTFRVMLVCRSTSTLIRSRTCAFAVR